MKLTKSDRKVIGKVFHYFQSLEEMAEYKGLDSDELIDKIKNQDIHLNLEEKSAFSNRRKQMLKDAEAEADSPLFNFPIR